MIPERRVPTHPGEILLEEFLHPLGLSQVALAKHIGVPVQRVNEIVSGKRGVTPETAWLLASALGTTPEFWVNAQSAYDLARSKPGRKVARVNAASTGRRAYFLESASRWRAQAARVAASFDPIQGLSGRARTSSLYEPHRRT
jgi:antitoxin HigA-1